MASSLRTEVTETQRSPRGSKPLSRRQFEQARGTHSQRLLDLRAAHSLPTRPPYAVSFETKESLWLQGQEALHAQGLREEAIGNEISNYVAMAPARNELMARITFDPTTGQQEVDSAFRRAQQTDAEQATDLVFCGHAVRGQLSKRAFEHGTASELVLYVGFHLTDQQAAHFCLFSSKVSFHVGRSKHRVASVPLILRMRLAAEWAQS